MLESRLEPGVWTVEPQLVGGDSPDLRASWSRRVDARSRSWLVVAVRGWVWPVYPLLVGNYREWVRSCWMLPRVV